MDTISSKERKRIQRRNYHNSMKQKASMSTSGSAKGIVATTLQRACCRRNRSWKWPNYEIILKTIGKRAGAKS